MPYFSSLTKCLVVAAICWGATLSVPAQAHAATFVVTNPGDSATVGACSADGTGDECTLRAAVAAANANNDPGTADVITFSPSIGDTIALSTFNSTPQGPTALVVSEPVSIQGPSANRIRIQRAGTSPGRLFLVNTTASFSNVGLDNGSIPFQDSYPANGGAIYNTGILSVSACAFTNNQAGSFGGAIDNLGTLSIQNCTFSGGRTDFVAGALYNESGRCTIESSSFSNNTSGSAGGAISNNDSMVIRNSTISGNTAPRAGGIENDSTLQIINSTVSGNSATALGSSNAGGIQSSAPSFVTTTISNCTITNNFSKAGAGGINLQGGSGSTTTLSNTIVAANVDNTTTPDVAGAILSSGYNFIGNVGSATGLSGSGDQTGTSSAPLDPQLGLLADNGGPTPTHALLKGSAAIDAGDPAFDVTSTPFDQRGDGYERVRGNRLDIGAFEVQNDAPVFATVTIDNATPKTNDVLTAKYQANDPNGDPLTVSYQWKKNGEVLSGETTATLDLSKAGNGDRGDDISVIVTASDGFSISSRESSSVTVADSAPVLTHVALQPDAPRTNDTLTVTATAADADNDSLTYAYTWLRNGVVIPKESGNTLDLSKVGNGSMGDTITVSVVASDGTDSSEPKTASVTVGNSPIVLTRLNLKSATPRTNDVLTADVQSSDADGGRPTYTFVWKKTYNGRTVTILTTSGTSSQSTYDLSKPTYGNKGDVITLTVTASDGQSNDSKTTSVTVGNTVPVMSSITFQSQSPTTTSIVRATAKATDIDATEHVDTLTYSYKWRIGTRVLAGETTSNLDLKKYPFVKVGDKVSVEVRASDGGSLSAAQTASVTVGGTETAPSAGAA